MKRRSFAIGLMSLLSASAFAQDKNQRTLVFLGDSLTAGLGLPVGQTFPARIEKKIKEAGLNWRVVNAGVSGDTTEGALRRMNWIYKNKIDLLFVCLGANDGFRGYDLKKTEQNLIQILERGKKEGSKLMLAGMHLPRNYGAKRADEFDAIFPRVAKKLGVPFYPFLLEGVALKSNLNQADGIHPNLAGTVVVAENVWRFIEPALK